MICFAVVGLILTTMRFMINDVFFGDEADDEVEAGEERDNLTTAPLPVIEVAADETYQGTDAAEEFTVADSYDGPATILAGEGDDIISRPI